MIVDLIFAGSISIPKEKVESFTKDFDDLLKTNSAEFNGTIKSYEFDDVEVIEDFEEIKN